MENFLEFPHFWYHFSPEFIAHTESLTYLLKKGSYSSGISILNIFFIFLYLFCTQIPYMHHITNIHACCLMFHCTFQSRDLSFYQETPNSISSMWLFKKLKGRLLNQLKGDQSCHLWPADSSYNEDACDFLPCPTFPLSPASFTDI